MCYIPQIEERVSGEISVYYITFDKDNICCMIYFLISVGRGMNNKYPAKYIPRFINTISLINSTNLNAHLRLFQI